MPINKSNERMSSPVKADDDPAVEAALGQRDVYQRFGRAAARTNAERKKAKRDAARQRALYDLPEDVIQAVDALAERISSSKSQVAAYLLITGLHAVANGQVDLSAARRPSRSPRFEYTLTLPKLPGKSSKNDD